MCLTNFPLSLAWAFHANSHSNSIKIVVIALILLLNSVSSGQGIPASLALHNGSGPSTAGLPSNNLKEYVIYSFIDGSSRDSENDRIRLHLGMILGPSDVKEYGGEHTGVEFWHVVMTEMQRDAFGSSNPRAPIFENAQFLYHDDLGLEQNDSQNVSDSGNTSSGVSNGTSIDGHLGVGPIYQTDAPQDLKVVSWAPGSQLATVRSYAYDSKYGGESVIYVIENGIDGRNREFFWPPPSWLYAPSVAETETDDDPQSHGSCVASKATGFKNGVSKTTKLVVVKSSLSLVDIAWALQRIVNAITEQQQKRAVVLLTATTRVAWQSQAIRDVRFSRLYRRLKDLIDLGAVVVVPAGNYGRRSFFADTVPAVFASQSKMPGTQPLPLIVAGAVDNRGAEATWSQSTLTENMVWAPGVKVACTKKGWNIRPTESGTSFSAAMVAGLAAYFLGMRKPPFPVGSHETSKNMLDYLHVWASWSRLPGKRQVIWNGLDGSHVSYLNFPANASDHQTTVAQQKE